MKSFICLVKISRTKYKLAWLVLRGLTLECGILAGLGRLKLQIEILT